MPPFLGSIQCTLYRSKQDASSSQQYWKDRHGGINTMHCHVQASNMHPAASRKPYWCLVMPPLVHPNSIQSNQKNNKDRNTVENTDTNTDTHKGHFGCAHISSIEPPAKIGMGYTRIYWARQCNQAPSEISFTFCNCLKSHCLGRPVERLPGMEVQLKMFLSPHLIFHFLFPHIEFMSIHLGRYDIVEN